MVIDYVHADHAISAQKLLTACGVGVVYFPYLLVPPDDGDVVAAHRVVHRLEVPDGYAEWTRALLAEHWLIHPAVEAAVHS